MTTTAFNRPRQDAGTPSGGEFKAYGHSDSVPALTGRHAAPASSNRSVPESLRMAHFQDPNLQYELEWLIERSADGDDLTNDLRCEAFSDHIPHLQVEEAYGYFNQALAAARDGGDWQSVVKEAAAADTARHPGGTMSEGYEPPVPEHRPGYLDSIMEVGAKYTGSRDGTEISKDIRKELTAAQAANYLPASLAFSVKTDKFAGGQAIRVVVQGVADADRTMNSTDLDHHGDLDTLPEFKELGTRVEAITNSFNRQDVNSGRDYWNVNYYSSVSIETDAGKALREAEAAARKANAAARAAKK
jgi:hypothetical protein